MNSYITGHAQQIKHHVYTALPVTPSWDLFHQVSQAYTAEHSTPKTRAHKELTYRGGCSVTDNRAVRCQKDECVVLKHRHCLYFWNKVEWLGGFLGALEKVNLHQRNPGA